MTQQLTVRDDRSGETAIAVDIDPEPLAHVQQLVALTGAELPEDGLVNLDRMRDSVSARPGVTVIRIESPEEHRVEVEFAFADAQALFPSASLLWEAGLVSFEEVEEGTRMRLYLDLDNYKHLSEIFPMLDDPVVRAMGPEENTEITSEVYLTMMGFFLGPSGPDAIADSLITIELTVEGELVSQSGGRVEDGVVIFEVPLLDLLLLHEPIDLQVVFR